MIPRCVAIILSASLLAAVPANASSQATATAHHTTKVAVVVKDGSFKFSRSSAPRGVVVFTVLNKGTTAHGLYFPTLSKHTPLLQPGTSARLKINFKRRGRYYYVCQGLEHSERGEAGAFDVR